MWWVLRLCLDSSVMAGNSSRLDHEREWIFFIYSYSHFLQYYSAAAKEDIYSKKDERVIRACVTRCTDSITMKLLVRSFSALLSSFLMSNGIFWMFWLEAGPTLFVFGARTHILSWHPVFYSWQMCRAIIISRALLLLLAIELILQEFRMKNPQGCALHVICIRIGTADIWNGDFLLSFFSVIQIAQHLNVDCRFLDRPGRVPIVPFGPSTGTIA